MEYDVAILGGGAAGLAAAVAAAEAGARCIVLEAADRIGRSILASGNGRCNFSNARIDPSLYRNADFVGQALSEFEGEIGRGCAGRTPRSFEGRSSETLCPSMPSAPRASATLGSDARSAGTQGADPCAFSRAPNAVVAFFEDRGLVWREEGEGRLYPLANKASVVLDVLRACLDAGGAQVRCDARVQAVETMPGDRASFTLHLEGGTPIQARSVIVAGGGAMARQLLPNGFAYTAPQPVLGPIATDTGWVRRLDNIRVRCAASLVRKGDPVQGERGELLFRKYGVSGIMMFNLSRMARPGDVISIDFLPDIPADQLPAFLDGRVAALTDALGTRPSAADLLRGMVLPPIAAVLLERAGLQAACPLAADGPGMSALADQLKAFTLEYRGIGDERNCQVHRGGFAVEGFDARTCESHAVPGLHVVGEALDVDGPCGGYNLHWAFASGILAGRHAALLACGARRA